MKPQRKNPGFQIEPNTLELSGCGLKIPLKLRNDHIFTTMVTMATMDQRLKSMVFSVGHSGFKTSSHWDHRVHRGEDVL